MAILGPLWRPGYLIALDSSIAVNWQGLDHLFGVGEGFRGVFAATVNSAPVGILLTALSRVLPPWLVEKLWLFLLLALAGFGASRLPFLRGPGRVYAGLFYMVNPLPYIRLVTGQWGFLGAYCLAPFALRSFLDLLEGRRRRDAVRLALWTTLAGLLQVHGLLLLLFLFALLLALRLVPRVGLPLPRRAWGLLTASGALFLLLNLFWLLPLAVSRETVLSRLEPREVFLFAPKPVSPLGVPFDVASLYAFWRPSFLHVGDILPLGWLLFGPVLLLAVYGLTAAWGSREMRGVAFPLLAAGVAGFLLALAPASGIPPEVVERAWALFPPLRAFRETQKFLLWLALAYAFLGGIGLQALLADLRGARRRGPWPEYAVGGVALALPLVYTLPMVGTWGQIAPVDFPRGWYEVRQRLLEDPGDYAVLFLPWHMYLRLEWLPNRDKIVANPARRFFPGTVLSGDNIELPGIPTQSPNPVSRYIQFLLAHREGIRDLGALLAPLNVRYVILAHEADYQAYDFLYRQRDLEVVGQWQGVTLFRNLRPTARAYLVDSIRRIQGWEDLFRRREGGEGMPLYLLDRAPVPPPGTPLRQPTVQKVTPVRFRIQGGSPGLLVFSLPQTVVREGWRLDGEPPVAYHLGLMPVFSYRGGEATITYGPFTSLSLPALLVSTLALLGCLVSLFPPVPHPPGGDDAPRAGG